MNQAIIDFLTDAKDGQMYLMPNALYAEYFAYRKDIFGQYGLEVPKTWDEFLNVCKVLKDNGEIPLIVGGKEGLQPVEKTVIDRCVHQIYQKYFEDPRPENMPILQDLYEAF